VHTLYDCLAVSFVCLTVGPAWLQVAQDLPQGYVDMRFPQGPCDTGGGTHGTGRLERGGGEMPLTRKKVTNQDESVNSILSLKNTSRFCFVHHPDLFLPCILKGADYFSSRGKIYTRNAAKPFLIRRPPGSLPPVARALTFRLPEGRIQLRHEGGDGGQGLPHSQCHPSICPGFLGPFSSVLHRLCEFDWGEGEGREGGRR